MRMDLPRAETVLSYSDFKNKTHEQECISSEESPVSLSHAIHTTDIFGQRIQQLKRYLSAILRGLTILSGHFWFPHSTE